MAVFLEDLLHLIPRLSVDDRFLLTGENFVEVGDLADILAVGEERVDAGLIPRTLRMHLAFVRGPGFPLNALRVEFLRQI